VELIAGAALGALAIILLALGWAAYLARGHRIDLSGVSVRREWTPLAEREDYAFSQLPTAGNSAERWFQPAFTGPRDDDRGAYDGARSAGLSHGDANAVANRAASMQHGQKTNEARGEDE
jgi:hypothetical protein